MSRGLATVTAAAVLLAVLLQLSTAFLLPSSTLPRCVRACLLPPPR